jgi:hypothetical protein
MLTHRASRIPFVISLIALAVWVAFPQAASATGSVATYRPVSPEELQMTGDPNAPGAPAIILYREVYRDDTGRTSHEDNYVRIKIFTEEGRKSGDIEIPYEKEGGDIVDIHARTIKPDGTIVEFEGKPFTKMVTKAQGYQIKAKTFTLPAVQPGCIIEYFYTIDFADQYIFGSHWILNDELFTRAADFSLKPYVNDSYNNFHLSWTWENLPLGADHPKQENTSSGVVRLHLSNVPAFIVEDLMPPENELKGRVDFKYTQETLEQDNSKFWAGVGRKLNGNVEGFIGKPKNLEPIAAEIVGPNDPPEVKLRKIYARVQQMRNTDYEVKKTEEEEKREKEKEPSNAEEAWKKGYANGTDLTALYLGLVRAAGFEAYGVQVPNRQDYFFNPIVPDERRLDQLIVLVKLNNKNIFCDPGSMYTPFGLLPWSETGVQGLQLDKKDPTWIQSLSPSPDQARTERHASMILTETGDLEGKLTVTYTGLEAARTRRIEKEADETDRKKYLEDTVKESVPAACEVTLTNQPEWKSSESPLVAEFNFKIPGWASQAGRHVLVSTGLFSAREKHLFDHADRVHPIYVDYPYEVADDIDIQLPAGWKISTLPTGWVDTGKVVTYTLTAKDDNGKLHLSRSVAVSFILLDSKYYSALRRYFQQIKATDDEQVVVEPAAANASN